MTTRIRAENRFHMATVLTLDEIKKLIDISQLIQDIEAFY